MVVAVEFDEAGGLQIAAVHFMYNKWRITKAVDRRRGTHPSR